MKIKIKIGPHRLEILRKIFFETQTKREYKEMLPLLSVIYKDIEEAYMDERRRIRNLKKENNNNI